MGIATINPTTGETVKTFTPLTAAEIEQKIALAQTAFEKYRLTAFEDRAAKLYKAAEILERDTEKFAQIMTLEMGKPITGAIAEVKKCALVCRFYADNGAEFLADREVESDASLSLIRYQPLGAILAVMPWNFPFWQVFRFAAPTLMAGNVGLLKHASNVPQCAIAIEDIFTEAGFPPGVFQNLLIGSAQVEDIIKDDRIKAVTLTGSEPAGASVAATAGQVIKKTVLELGGSDPFIVLESADLDAAATTAAKARMLNNGQSCIAAKRFIVAESVAAEFEQKLIEQFKALKVGDPADENTHIGPLATPEMLEDIHQQVRKTVEMGATIVMGGQPLDSPGNFYPPTILKDIPKDSPGDTEEFFGPVALLFCIKDLDEAIQIANGTEFGLGASAWTENPQERDRLLNEIEAGAVFINGLVKSDPRLPFGGIKRSGYGRELGMLGIHEFVNIKTIWIK
ncbi:MAG: NAD-dependent succinate-semialdehyde dehydrogenase [Spirulinaceae cyanobacterium]